MRRMLLSEIAGRFHLTLQGDDCAVTGVATLSGAGPDELSFLANPKYSGQLSETRAAAVIIHPSQAGRVRRALLSEHPYQDFGRILALFAASAEEEFAGISGQAFVHPQACLGEDVRLAPFVHIGPRAAIGARTRIFPGCYVGADCAVGEDSILYPNVSLMAGTRIGKRCILHAGVVLGADGFGFARTAAGIEKIPQAGTVTLGDEVEVGANTTIDRAALDRTVIGDGTKIDNLVMVAHNVRVGRNSFLVSQTGISGSAQLGDNVTLAGQVGVAGHLRIGNNATIGPKGGVGRDVPDNAVLGGSPAVDQTTYLRTLALMPRFPELFKRLSRLEKEMDALRAARSGEEPA